MITVLCVRFGNKYGRDYVEKLRNMVSRHLTVPYKFVCLTDDPTPIDGVENIVQPNANYAKGWWHKIHMFDPNLGLQGRVLYMDLDVVIHNNIDKIVNYPGDFLGIRDFNRKFHPHWNSLNSSVLCWTAGDQSDIFISFKNKAAEALRMHGDQDWIFFLAKNRLKFWPDEWIQSYKWEIRSRSEIDFSKTPRTFREVRNPEIPADCSICVFHGDPNPHNIQDQYIIDNWK